MMDNYILSIINRENYKVNEKKNFLIKTIDTDEYMYSVAFIINYLSSFTFYFDTYYNNSI